MEPMKIRAAWNWRLVKHGPWDGSWQGITDDCLQSVGIVVGASDSIHVLSSEREGERVRDHRELW